MIPENGQNGKNNGLQVHRTHGRCFSGWTGMHLIIDICYLLFYYGKVVERHVGVAKAGKGDSRR